MINHIRHGIHISGRTALKDVEAVKAKGIKAVVRLDHAVPDIRTKRISQWSETDVDLLYLPIYDGETIPDGTFEQVTAFIHRHVEQDNGVLVHCQMGVSRSVTTTMAYFIEYDNMTLPQAFGLVRYYRPQMYPHPNLLWSLVQHYDLPYSKDEVKYGRFLDRLREESEHIDFSPSDD